MKIDLKQSIIATFGHFEIDTVIGTRRGKHECLLTIIERKTKFEIIFKISSKTSENVVNKINQMKVFMNKYYNKIFKSFSTENGSEFSDFLGIIKDTKTQIYFVTHIVLVKKEQMKNKTV